MLLTGDRYKCAATAVLGARNGCLPALLLACCEGVLCRRDTLCHPRACKLESVKRWPQRIALLVWTIIAQQAATPQHRQHMGCQVWHVSCCIEVALHQLQLHARARHFAAQNCPTCQAPWLEDTARYILHSICASRPWISWLGGSSLQDKQEAGIGAWCWLW